MIHSCVAGGSFFRRVPVPCRITVLSSRGALATTGASSTDRLAVRPGVIYTADGTARFGLPAGDYTIVAGRGFAYGIDTARVSLKPGEKRTVSFTLAPEQLSVIDDGGRRVIEPGKFIITIGGKQPGFKGHTDAVHSVAIRTDGKHIVSGSADETVKVWDAVTGQEALSLQGHNGIVYSVAFTPDGKRLASGSFDTTVRVWDAGTGEEMFSLKGHRKEVRGVTFSPDENWLASAGDDGTIRIWGDSGNHESFAV